MAAEPSLSSDARQTFVSGVSSEELPSISCRRRNAHAANPNGSHREDGMGQNRESKVALAGWAHDLSKPLQVIGHYARRLVDDDNLSGEVLMLAREIEELSEGALRVVDRLMECGRSDTPHDLPSQGLREVVTRAEVVVRGLHPDHVLRVYEPIPLVRMEGSNRLFSILVNLVDNAMIACEAWQPIQLYARVAGACLVVDVVDAGGGMSDQVRECAFRPYFSTRNAQRPTGLGLAECHRLIEECGGELSLESVEGQGTRASVRLPL